FGLSGSAGPFADQGLAFYTWHAQQWFALGLARGGEDNPAGLLSASDWLRRWLAEDHVVIRDVVAQVVRRLLAGGSLAAGEAGKLDQANRSPFPREVCRGWEPAQDEEEVEADRSSSDDEKYYFG